MIYDLTINKAYCLNQTAGFVYQLCDGRRTVAEISDLMSKELKTLVSDDFVWLALNGLKKDGLLENADELANHFAGLTRREVVKRVGLASMVMLPLISSVAAPNAAMAQSGGIGLFGACVETVECQSGLMCNDCRGICPSLNWCCANTDLFLGIPPDSNLGCFINQNICDSEAAHSCCSGMATLVVNSFCSSSFPGTLACICT